MGEHRAAVPPVRTPRGLQLIPEDLSWPARAKTERCDCLEAEGQAACFSYRRGHAAESAEILLFESFFIKLTRNILCTQIFAATRANIHGRKENRSEEHTSE